MVWASLPIAARVIGMNRFRPVLRLTVSAFLCGLMRQRHRLPAHESAAVKAMFAGPPRQYSTGPLWVWNDLLTEAEIRSTLADLAREHVKQVWVHPRPGLMTPYLGKDWFRMWQIGLAEAERLDMNLWIYDENSYPSGFAGGFVPEAMPAARGQGLYFQEDKLPGKPTAETVAVYRLAEDGFENVTRQVRAAASLPEGRYLTASTRLAPTGGWFGGTFYVDLLRPGVTEKFIDIITQEVAPQLRSSRSTADR